MSWGEAASTGAELDTKATPIMRLMKAAERGDRHPRDPSVPRSTLNMLPLPALGVSAERCGGEGWAMLFPAGITKEPTGEGQPGESLVVLRPFRAAPSLAVDLSPACPAEYVRLSGAAGQLPCSARVEWGWAAGRAG